MSWDISIQDLPEDARTLEEIPDDYQPKPLGNRIEIIARIQEVLPGVDFSDPSWGMLDDPSFSIEFNMGSEELCTSFMLHVRGGGNAMTTITRLLNRLKLRGIDCQTSGFFSPEAAEASFSEWKLFRDRALNSEDTKD